MKLKNEYVNLYDVHGRSLGATNEWQRVPDAFDYIIFKDGDVVKAKNGRTGKIEFEGSATEVIQSAINYGNSVYIMKGEYVIDDTIIIQKEGLLLMSDFAVLKLADNANVSLMRLVSPCSDIVLEGLVFDGNKSKQTEQVHNLTTEAGIVASNLVIRRCVFRNATGANINFDNPNNSIIEECWFEGSDWVNLRLHSNDNVVVRNCYFDNEGVVWTGIILDGRGNRIESNYILGSSDDSIQQITVAADGTYEVRDNVISNNVIIGRGGGVGVTIGFSDYILSNIVLGNAFYNLKYAINSVGKRNVVVNNVCYNCSRFINASNVQESVISQNHMHVTDRGVSLYATSVKNVISNNVLVGESAWAGVYEDTASCDYNIITNNIIEGFATALDLKGANDVNANNITA